MTDPHGYFVYEASAVPTKTLLRGANPWVVIIIIGIMGISTPLHAGEYGKAVAYNLKRGIKNVIGSPLEIPVTIQDYHEQAGPPFIRHMIGFAGGTFRMVARFGSGAWDLVAAWIPNLQKGLPVKPETFF